MTQEKIETLDEYQKRVRHDRKIKAQAAAILQRAKNAGIPEKYMRIKPSVFYSLLDPSYHRNPEQVTDFVFKQPMELLKKEFIIIDGGNVIDRKKASFAILFRLIACDKKGVCKSNGELSHQLQTIHQDENGFNRNDLTSQLRSADLLLLSEAMIGDFTKNFDTGRFYDEVLSYRDDHVKTTIITFANALSSRTQMEGSENSWTDQVRFGQNMCLAAQADSRKDERFYRIRVKSNG